MPSRILFRRVTVLFCESGCTLHKVFFRGHFFLDVYNVVFSAILSPFQNYSLLMDGVTLLIRSTFPSFIRFEGDIMEGCHGEQVLYRLEKTLIFPTSNRRLGSDGVGEPILPVTDHWTG